MCLAGVCLTHSGLKERSVMDAIIAGGQFFIYDSLKILLKIAPKDIVAR